MVNTKLIFSTKELNPRLSVYGIPNVKFKIRFFKCYPIYYSDFEGHGNRMVKTEVNFTNHKIKLETIKNIFNFITVLFKFSTATISILSFIKIG